METLLIISGTSGSGKTTQLKFLEQEYGHGRVITITTRERRGGETVEDYHFVDEESLCKMESSDETIWVIGRYGKRYSITREAIRKPLRENNGLAFVAITPDYHSFLSKWCAAEVIRPINIHLLPPEEEEQLRRLKKRDKNKFNASRVSKKENDKFESDADNAADKINLHFIRQSEPDHMFGQIKKIIEAARARI